MQLQFGTLKSRPPFDRSEIWGELLQRLNAIPGLAVPESRSDLYPSFPMQRIATAEAQKAFFETFDWALEAIRSAAEEG